MKNVRRRLGVAAISGAIAIPALLSAATADAAPAQDVYYPIVPPCVIPVVPEPTGSSVHPCTPTWLMTILQAASMGSTDSTGSAAGSSTGS